MPVLNFDDKTTVIIVSNCAISYQLQRYLAELIKRNVINSDGLNDQMLINHLRTQKLDEDYYKAKPSPCPDFSEREALDGAK